MTSTAPRGLRLIAPVRLSRATEATTSPESQAEGIEEWARRKGHTIVATTQDLDVSGGTEIRKRPGVGPWLVPERLGEMGRHRGLYHRQNVP